MDSRTWKIEFNRLSDQLVPASGQAPTVQGELIRSIGRLTDEAYRNGNGNFDDGYRMMCRYLREKLSDPNVFTNDDIKEINQCIDRILVDDRPDVMGPTTSYDRVAEKVVRWCMARQTPIPHQQNPDLYR
jgi:hypothetical protein